MKRIITSRSKVFPVLLAAIVSAAALSITGCASAATPSDRSSITTTVAHAQETASAAAAVSSQDTVTVSAKGSTRAIPDRAELHFGIRTQAETAEKAGETTSEVDARMAEIEKLAAEKFGNQNNKKFEYKKELYTYPNFHLFFTSIGNSDCAILFLHW